MTFDLLAIILPRDRFLYIKKDTIFYLDREFNAEETVTLM